VISLLLRHPFPRGTLLSPLGFPLPELGAKARRTPDHLAESAAFQALVYLLSDPHA